MKKFYSLLTLTLVSFLLTTSFAFGQQIEKTLVQSLNLEHHSEVALNLPGEIEVEKWDNALMRVQITIILPNGNEAMLKSLISAGRYSVQSKAEENGSLTILAPNLSRKVTVGGKELEEQISYVIYAPKDVLVKQVAEGASSYTNTSAASSSF